MYFKGHEDIKIAVDVWGSDNEELVILLHGGGQTRHAWGDTGKKLAEAGVHLERKRPSRPSARNDPRIQRAAKGQGKRNHEFVKGCV